MQGLFVYAIVHSAGVQDRDGGIWLLATLFGQFPFLAKLFADSAYAGSQRSAKSCPTSKPKSSAAPIEPKGSCHCRYHPGHRQRCVRGKLRRNRVRLVAAHWRHGDVVNEADGGRSCSHGVRYANVEFEDLGIATMPRFGRAALSGSGFSVRGQDDQSG